MSNEELQVKINEYCGSQETCEKCVFYDAIDRGFLCGKGFSYASSSIDSSKRLKALNRFKKEILGEGKKTITLQFELLEDGYKLITEDETLKEIIFDTKDLTDLTQAEATQAKLEYIFYKVRKGERK